MSKQGMPGQKMTVSEVAEFLNENDNYLILTHIRPDGDTIGCASALTLALRDVGKTAYMLENPELTARYAPFAEGCFAPPGFEPDFVIAVDTATTELIPSNASKYIGNIALCIDHHGTNTGYAERVCCLPDCASCGEIVYGILSMLLYKNGISMNARAADSLYVAVSTDTGCFSYGNTTANSHSVAEGLIVDGADSKRINKLLFRTKRRERIAIDGLINSGIEYYFDSKVAVVVITQEMMAQSGANEDDIDDISNVASSIEGVCIGITIRELTPKSTSKISVRTVGPYDASALCLKFGGGGHFAAAGATINKPADAVLQDLLAELENWKLA